MRILTVGNMYPPHHLGGYELTWRSSVNQLRSAGHEVRVLTTDFQVPDPAEPEGPDVHRELGWYWRDHDFPRRGAVERLRLERHNARVLDRHLEDLAPEAVAWWAMGGMSLSLTERVRSAGVPAVGVVGDDWMLYGPKVDAWTRAVGRLPRLGRLAGAAIGVPSTLELGAAGRWLFNSAFSRDRNTRDGLRLPETSVLHPGIDASGFDVAPERPWRDRLLCAGRLDPRKGVDTAVEALRLLPSEATLQIVGSGDSAYARSLERTIGDLGGRVRMSPQVPQPELARAYGEADALVFPVVWEEPWGLVPLEAMACGTPVIATGTGGSAEYLADGENCLLFAPGDARALADAVLRLRRDPDLRARLRGNGLETSARYTEDAYNRAIESALLEVAGGGPH